MALTGANNEEKIWNYLKAKGLNDYGVAGCMGNLYAESGLRPNNLQNTYEKKLGYTDDEYVAAVDNGSYSNFIKDSAGFGLAQWTYWSRKQGLLDYAISVKKSIGDLEMQLGYLYKELSENYKAVLNTLKTASSVRAASDSVLLNFERPADQSTTVQVRRAGYGKIYYDKYASTKTTETTSKEEGGATVGYTNSSLVSYTKISPNKSSPRNHAIDTITIHCVVGQCSVETLGNVFAPTSRQASSNYGVGVDGRIGMYVEEKDRSWCSSNAANDNRAITIEVASDTTEPYAVNAKAYAALLDLVTDICKRNGIKKLVWSTNKNERVNHLNGCNMTVHRDYDNKSCPGTYLYNKHGEIAAEVNKRLGSSSTGTTTNTSANTDDSQNATNKTFPSTPFTVQVLVSDLNYRSTGSMSSKVLGQTGKGVFTITEVKAGWGRLKSGAGWIYLENASYVKVGSTVGGSSTSPSTSSVPYKVKVTADVLNIRKGAGTNYGVSGAIRDRGVYTIVAEASGNGASKWGKLKSGAGWISLDYTKKI